MGLLEREAECSLVKSLLTQLSNGRGNVVVVSGPAGTGRTALLSAFAELACVVGIPVFAGGYSSFEEGLDLELLERVVDKPALVCVDDVHRADDESTARLMRLASAARSMPIVLVLGMRAGVRQTQLEAAAYLRDRVQAHRIDLGALSLSGVRGLAAVHGLDVDERTARRMSEVADGNLTLLKSVFADFAGAGAGTAGLARMIGPAYRRSVLECLHRLSLPARAVGRAIAVLREFTTPRSVAEVVELSLPAVDEAMGELRTAGLLRNGRFHHPGAESAVLDALAIQESAVLHQRAAVAMREMGVPAVEVARRLIVADQADASWTGYLVNEVVVQALAQDDRVLATDALRLALRGAVGDEARADILVRVAIGYEATDPELCCQYFHEATALVPEAQLWARTSSVLSAQMSRRGRGREALRRLAATVGGVDATATDRLRVAADRLLVCGDYPALADTAGAPPLTTVPEDAGREAARYAAARFLVLVLSEPELDPDDVRAVEDAFYGCTFSEDTAATSLAALTGLLYAGRLELVGSLATELVRGTRRRRTPVWQARFLALRAEAMVRSGRYEHAAADAERALSLLSPSAWGVWIGGPVSSLALAATMTGERAAAHRRLDAAVPASMYETRYGAHYLYGRGHLHLAKGRARAALADFAGCGRLLAASNIDHGRVLPWRLAAAGALLALGDQDEAVDLIDDHVRRSAHRMPGPEGGARPADGHRTPREWVFDALSGAVRDGGVVEAVRSVVATAGAPARRGAARYRIEDRYSRYLDKLTVSEQQVAMLAAMGRSNRNIARSLSVTVSTVEQHLTRTYRKLQVAGRQELRARLG